jgi:plasmid stabilization system protein ParE
MLFFYKDAMDDEILYNKNIFETSKNRHKSNFLKTAKAILSNRTTKNRRFRLSQLEWIRLQNHGKLIHISAFFDLLDRIQESRTVTSMISNVFKKRDLEDFPQRLNEKLQRPIQEELIQSAPRPNMDQTKQSLNGFMEFLNEQCPLFTLKESKRVLARIKQNYRTFQNKGLRVKLINHQFMYDILYCALVEFLSFKYIKISFLVFTHELFDFNINQFLEECIHYKSKRKPFKPNYEIQRYNPSTEIQKEEHIIAHYKEAFKHIFDRYFKFKDKVQKEEYRKHIRTRIKKLIDEKKLHPNQIREILEQYKIIQRKSDGSKKIIRLKPEIINSLVS